MIRQYMTNGIAKFSNAQIYQHTNTSKVELMRVGQDLIPLDLGKNASRLYASTITAPDIPIKQLREGAYFYWWSKPLINYYHLMLDGVGCLWHYFELHKTIPNIKLLLNQTPRSGINKYPPFVFELLNLLDIDYELTDDTHQYESLYFGDTLCQDKQGKRQKPRAEQYELLERIIRRAHSSVHDVPQHEKIYLSRRTRANPRYTKDLIGEDNTQKRGLINEDEVVEILSKLGYTEVFGENYTLAEKIVLFGGMSKYISSAGAGVTNILWVRNQDVHVGGIHSAGFPFPGNNHSRHICTQRPYSRAIISTYHGKVLFVDEKQGLKNYNSPWYINNLDAFAKWAETI